MGCWDMGTRIILLIVLSFSLFGCANQFVTLAYKKYEPTKGGRLVYIKRPTGGRHSKWEAEMHKQESDLMRGFCDPEPFRIIDEGTEASGTSSSVGSSYGGSAFASTTQNKQYFMTFECGKK